MPSVWASVTRRIYRNVRRWTGLVQHVGLRKPIVFTGRMIGFHTVYQKHYVSPDPSVYNCLGIGLPSESRMVQREIVYLNRDRVIEPRVDKTTLWAPCFRYPIIGLNQGRYVWVVLCCNTAYSIGLDAFASKHLISVYAHMEGDQITTRKSTSNGGKPGLPGTQALPHTSHRWSSSIRRLITYTTRPTHAQAPVRNPLLPRLLFPHPLQCISRLW